MTAPVQALPSIGSPNSTEDVKVRSCLSEIQTIINGNIDAANVTNGSLGLTDLSTAAGNTWVKLASAANVKVIYGLTATGGFGGSASLEGSVSFGTTFGSNPVVLLITGIIATFAAETSAIAISTNAVTTTGCTWKARIANQSPSNNSTSLWWLAIGPA